MKKFVVALALLAGVAGTVVAVTAPASADCRWEYNGNRMQQICRN